MSKRSMRARKRRRKALIQGVAVSLAGGLAFGLQGGVANAANCFKDYIQVVNGHNIQYDLEYGGQILFTKTPLGIERNISTTASNVPNLGTQHMIFYLDASDDRTSCNGKGSCWLQIGFGAGTVSNSTTAGQAQQVYLEYSSNGDGYYGVFLPLDQNPLGADDYFNVYDTGGSENGHPLYQASHGTLAVAIVPLTGVSDKVVATAEGLIVNGDPTWPVIDTTNAHPAAFGLPTSKVYDPNFSLFKTYAATANEFVEWTGVPDQTCDTSGGAPYSHEIIHNYSAFKTAGGG